MEVRDSNRYGLWTSDTGFNIKVLCILAALEIMVSFSPIGFINIPPISIATGHIIVMLAAMWSGPVGGGLMGALFGLCSMWQAEAITVNPMDIIFAPLRNGTFVSSLMLSVVSRALFGFIAGLVFLLLFSRDKKNRVYMLPLMAILLDRLHSTLVYTFMYALFDVEGVTPLLGVMHLFSIQSILVYMVASAALIAFYKTINSVWGMAYCATAIRIREAGITLEKGRTLRIVMVTLFLAAVILGISIKAGYVVQIDKLSAEDGSVRLVNVLLQGFMAITAMFMLIVGATQYTLGKRELLKLESERELKEQLAIARTEAERANEAKNAFISGVSRDIRTPMNAIMGFAGMMRKETDNLAALTLHLDKLISTGEYMTSLVTNVMDIASIDDGKTQLTETVFDMKGASDDIMAILEKDIAEKKLRFVENFNIAHRYIYADGVKVRQVWLNVISNAVRNTPEGGTITITTTEIPSDKPNLVRYQCVIADGGMGISREHLTGIFKNFDKAGSDNGTPIVRKLVELMGGTIEASHEPGRGTQVTITLPHRIAKPPKANHTGDENTGAGNILEGRNILIAEDNDLCAEIAESILNEMGISTERALDGAMAVDMLRKADSDRYDLILMDIQMPNMDGYTATDMIRDFDNKRKARIPILAMTASVVDEDKRRALNVGMDGHVAKPIDVKKLKEALEIALK